MIIWQQWPPAGQTVFKVTYYAFWQNEVCGMRVCEWKGNVLHVKNIQWLGENSEYVLKQILPHTMCCTFKSVKDLICNLRVDDSNIKLQCFRIALISRSHLTFSFLTFSNHLPLIYLLLLSNYITFFCKGYPCTHILRKGTGRAKLVKLLLWVFVVSLFFKH